MLPTTQCTTILCRASWLLALVLTSSTLASAEPCKEDAKSAARVDISLDWENSSVAVDPELVEIYLSTGPDKVNRVCWVVDGLQDGQTLQIEAKPDQEEFFPSLERNIKFPKDFANSGRPAQAGTWTYNVVVVNDAGEELLRLDPGVDIKP